MSPETWDPGAEASSLSEFSEALVLPGQTRAGAEMKPREGCS